jgi:hypothetical protein
MIENLPILKANSQPEAREQIQIAHFPSAQMQQPQLSKFSGKQLNLVVATVDGCVLLYSDVFNNFLSSLQILPLLQGRHEMATAVEVADGSQDILVGLYSRFLVRYSSKTGASNEMHIAEVMKFDSPILAIDRGDIFGIGKEVVVVVTVSSVHVIGP